MTPSPEAIQALLNRTFSEVAQKAVFAARARTPFNLLLSGQQARARVGLAIGLVVADAVTPAGRGRYQVTGAQYTLERPYQVTQGPGCSRATCGDVVHCSCPDHLHRGGRCKHSLAVGLYLRSGGAR